ncbi:MAG: ATP-binding cassette domain-containing protein [Oscillospiraceae bacterium]|nr:ATP-binding cassette domain-containing protein [Oscillospiraceae bacterium]
MMLRAEQISKQYFRRTGGANYFHAVKPVSLELQPGTVTVLCGRSGSGKTTLLHMLSGLLRPTEGRVLLGETDLYALSDRELSQLRNRFIGVVPQGRSVLDTLTVEENILLPGTLYAAPDRREAAARWMARLNIEALAQARASELSGGELRRTAIARTMCAAPDVILADEPTGDLDDENTALVFACFREAAAQGAAVFIVSHESDALQIADRAFRMDAGEMNPL